MFCGVDLEECQILGGRNGSDERYQSELHQTCPPKALHECNAFPVFFPDRVEAFLEFVFPLFVY